MITEHDLRESLRALERFAPDPDPVAARIAAGVRTQGRRRTAVMAAAAAGTAVAVAVPIGLLGHGRGPTVAAPTTSAPSPTPAAIRFDPLTVPFTVGWLPAGWHASTIETGSGSASRTYEGPRPTDRIVVTAVDPRASDRSRVRPTGSTAGSVVYHATSGSVTSSALKRMTDSVRLTSAQPLTFPFRLTWVPDGFRLLSAQTGAHRWHGNAAGGSLAADPPVLVSALTLDPRRSIPKTEAGGLNIGVSTEDGSAADKGLTPNGILLGRPSRYTRDADSAVLTVYGLNGMHVSVTADTRQFPALTRAVLERLVGGLRLVPSPADTANWTPDPLP